MSEVAEATPIVEGEALAALSVSGIIRLMRKDWKATSKKGIYFGAVPYLDALGTLESLSESYGMDTGKGMVPYLLSNATTYRGKQAAAIKKELKKRAGIK